MNDINDFNVVFITIDSCRYDTAEVAKTPFLDSISKLRKGETHATFTYPAHHAFFIGNLPNILNIDTNYIYNYKQIWRSWAARDTSKNVAINYEWKNIVEHYILKWASVVWAGWVSFFNSVDNKNTLPQLFPKFLYYWDPKYIPRENRLPRSSQYFPLSNIDDIVNQIDWDKQFFIFINCPETHIPYDCPSDQIDNTTKEIIMKIYTAQDSKQFYNTNKLLTEDEIIIIKNMQIKSLERIDEKLGNLVAKLPKNNRKTLLIAIADHGEEIWDGWRFWHAHFHESIMYVPVWVGVF
jgi:uncharacterized protein (UPF0297 family)